MGTENQTRNHGNGMDKNQTTASYVVMEKTSQNKSGYLKQSSNGSS
jgi:hypothetical protein